METTQNRPLDPPLIGGRPIVGNVLDLTRDRLAFMSRLAEMGTLALTPAFIILLSPLAYATAKALLVKSVKYEISSERIKITTGIFSKQTNAMELYRIKDYFLNEPFFFRLFHLGNIVVLTSDQSTPQIVMRAIHGAKPLMDELRTNVEMRRDAKKVREVDFGPTGDPGDPSS